MTTAPEAPPADVPALDYTRTVDRILVHRVPWVAGAPVGFDLSRSSAYGDHISDLPMLQAVGRPIAVGDDPDLAAHALRSGWAA